MRPLTLVLSYPLVACGWAADLPTLASMLADAAALPATVQATLDVDGDKVLRNEVEVLASLLRSPPAWRAALPAAVSAINTDGDASLSLAEVQTLADRSTEFRFRLKRAQGGGAAADGSRPGGHDQASVYFGTQQSYIADYDVVGGNYKPVISTLSMGTALTVADVTITVIRRRR
jgi:hypothetical protein